MRAPFRRGDAAAARLIELLEQFRAVFTLPVAWARSLTDQADLIDADVAQWVEVLGAGEGCGLHSLLYAFGEFRALYYHRLSHGNAAGALAAKVLRFLWRPTPGLDITTPQIGPGLFIAHGQATCLAAASIGRNCYVHHGVTIGWDYRGARAPIIGDGVFVGTGAVVLGEVTIGDGARIGANAVVLCDVPAGATAVGSPARIIPAVATTPGLVALP
ncbi:MAG TPA: serine acetyltransferase [Acidimicrobiales bacterium]|nr:serine acetyltransferase [Acidimicrobiales bacterium]